MSWAAFKPWLVMALIFGVGMIAGAALVIAFRPEGLHEPPGAQQMRNHWLMHLTSRLDLTPDQQAKIGPILNEAVASMQRLHRDEVDQLAKIMDNANAQIEPLLTPQQQEKLKEIRNERERTFPGHMHSWEGPHGPDAGKNPPPGPPPMTPPPGSP